jgi:hypothetical protein
MDQAIRVPIIIVIMAVKITTMIKAEPRVRCENEDGEEEFMGRKVFYPCGAIVRL